MYTWSSNCFSLCNERLFLSKPYASAHLQLEALLHSDDELINQQKAQQHQRGQLLQNTWPVACCTYACRCTVRVRNRPSLLCCAVCSHDTSRRKALPRVTHSACYPTYALMRAIDSELLPDEVRSSRSATISPFKLHRVLAETVRSNRECKVLDQTRYV